MIRNLIFDDLGDRYKDSRPLGFKSDPIAHSVAAWRDFCQNPKVLWRDLASAVPGDEDHALADEIRRYYCDRIMFARLRGREITNYRRDLYALLNGDARPEHRHLGMIYKLPYFYHEDRTHETLAREFVSTALSSYQAKEASLVLSPVRSVPILRRGTRQVEYWWMDQDRNLVRWIIAYDNTLRGLLESLFVQGCVMHLDSTVKPSSLFGIPEFVFLDLKQARFTPGRMV